MKVMCIANGEEAGNGYGHEILPVIGEVYTVRSFEESVYRGETYYGYLLNEIVNTPAEYANGLREFFFLRHRFRPITDISELEKLTKVRELEDV